MTGLLQNAVAEVGAASVAGPRPVRVLDLRDTYEIGGPGKTILETFRAIDASRFELHLGVFLAHGESEDSPFVQAARDLRMPLHFIRGANPYDYRMIGQVVGLVRRLGIDVVHAHEVKSDVIAYALSLRERVSIMTTMHGWIANSLKQRALTALDKLVVDRFDCVIAVSGKMRADLIAAGVSERRIRIIHNAIVLERFRRTGDRGFLEAAIGRQLPGPVLVSIGRLSREKGHADLIEAVALLAAGGRRCSVVLVGDGPERAALAARVEQLGLTESVHFPGYLSDPARVLEAADLKVLPSHTEGLPNAALEALAMEVPVLATRVGGTPEVIADGDTGRLVPPRAPESLAAAIAEFLDHPDRWRDLAMRGRRLVEAQFNFSTRTRMMEDLYTELAQGRRR